MQKESPPDISQETKRFAEELDQALPAKMRQIENVSIKIEEKCYQDHSDNIEKFAQCMSIFKQHFDQQNRSLEYQLSYAFNKYNECIQSVKSDEIDKQAIIKCKEKAKETLDAYFNKFILDLSKI